MTTLLGLLFWFFILIIILIKIHDSFFAFFVNIQKKEFPCM